MKNFAAEWFDGESIKNQQKSLKTISKGRREETMCCRQFFVSYNYSFQKQAVKNIVKPDFGTNLGLVNCGILFNRRLVIWGIRNLIVDQLLIGRQINRLFRDRGLFYKYWFLTGLINRILYSRTSSLKHLSLFKGHFHPGDLKFGPGQIFT